MGMFDRLEKDILRKRQLVSRWPMQSIHLLTSPAMNDTRTDRFFANFCSLSMNNLRSFSCPAAPQSINQMRRVTSYIHLELL